MQRLSTTEMHTTHGSDSNTSVETVGLYDVADIAQIHPVIPDDFRSIEDKEAWRLKTTSNERFLVAAAGSDLTVFSLGALAEYFFSTSVEGIITDFTILGNSCFLVIVFDRKNIQVLSLQAQEVYLREKVNFTIDFVRTNITNDTCFLILGSYDGNIHTVALNRDVAESKENNRVENGQTSQIVEFFTKALLNTVNRKIDMGSVNGLITSISTGTVQSLASLNNNDNSILFSGFGMDGFIPIEYSKKWIQIRDTGRFVLLLDDEGYIHVFDPLTFCIIHEFDVKENATDKIIDFIVVENNKIDIPKTFTMVVERSNGPEMIIYDREKKERSLSIPCSSKSSIYAYEGSDRMLISIEELTDEQNLSNSFISIKQVSQSRPEMKFEALLKNNKYEEAEKFAKEYHLDIQKCYKAKVYYLTDHCDNDDDAFNNVMKTMEKITDHNMVSETFFSMVSMSRRFDRIHTYLCHAKKRKITDMEVLKMIENASYILATYRIACGPKMENEIVEKHWEYFVDALHGVERWVEVYLEFIKVSAITEARIIWSRHGESLLDFICCTGETNEIDPKSRVEELFNLLTISFTSDITSWSGIVEHLTADIFPQAVDLLDLLVPQTEIIINQLIKLLEYRDSENWPENGIEATSCFSSMTQWLSDNEITPSSQSFLALHGKNLVVPKAGASTTPILRIKRVFYTLKEIKHLKERYNCSINYSTYLTLSSEEICYKILQNALHDPTTIQAKIEKFVKPFMAERNLNQDQTIFNYIQMMSGTATNLIGWETQCVQLCSSLSDEIRKCQSIISIASSAKLPWPSALQESVSNILKSRTLPKFDIETMHIVCQKTELIRLLATYEYDRQFIDVLTKDGDSSVIVLIRTILAQAEKPSRFVDCIRVLELHSLVTKDERNIISVEYAKSLVVTNMMRSGEEIEEIINYVNELPEKEKDRVIELVVDFIKCVADTQETEANILSREQLLGVCSELLSYYTRHGHEEEQNMERLHRQLILLREVQKEVPNTAVLLSDFCSEEWKVEQLKRMCRSNESVYKNLERCNFLGIEVEKLISGLLGKAMNNGDAHEMVSTFCEFVDCLGQLLKPTHDIIDLLVDFLGMLIYELPNIMPDATEADRASEIAIVVKKLTEPVRTLIAICPYEGNDLEIDFLLQFEGYLHICERVIKQSLKGTDSETDVYSSSGTVTTSEASKIYGISRRHGCYDYSSDPALFEGISGVLAIISVAPSVARSRTREISEDESNKFRGSWEQLTMFLSMHSQNLLDISVRVYASSLRCYSGPWREAVTEMTESISSVVERMLEQDKFDAWHAITLLLGLPINHATQIITKLRGSTGAKRNTQSQLNYLQLAHFVAMVTNNLDILNMIVTTYEQKCLSKKLSKCGIRVSLNAPDAIDQIISQAAEFSTPMSADRLFEFVDKLASKPCSKVRKPSTSYYMIQYACNLLRRASTVGEVAESRDRTELIEMYLNVASSALDLIDEKNEESRSLCNHLITLLYVICPYNYELVEFIHRAVSEFATEPADVEFSKNLEHVIQFVNSYTRSSHITREESVWFTKRKHQLITDEKDYERHGNALDGPFGTSTRQSYEGIADEMSETISSSASLNSEPMVYEKNDVIITDMPPLSSKRIPVHIFLMRKKEDIDEIVMPIVKSELSIYNVSIWQGALRLITWLAARFSRTQLLSSAIFAHANKFAKVEQSLPVTDRIAIQSLLQTNTNRGVVISTIALLFRKIILSDVKIELLQMGVEMAEKWTVTEEIQPPIDAEEREQIVEQCARLRDGIAKFYTELALKKNGLYNGKTADNIEKTEELCTLIYAEMIDWEDSKDTERKGEIVEKIANANGLNLADLHEKLVFEWIEDQEANKAEVVIDFNDSFGEASFMDNKVEDPKTNDDVMKLPLFDKNVDKMVFLCKNIDKKKLLNRLAAILIKGGPKAVGGFNAVARASCVMLRSFTNEELQSWNEKASHLWVCENLETQLYSRLSTLTKMKCDENGNKHQMIKTLLQSPSRTPTMTAYIACLIIDYSYDDTKNIEQIMARLQVSKQWSVLTALLNYMGKNKMDSMMRSFPLLWFKVYENAVTEINYGTTPKKDWTYQQCVLLRKWSLWVMGSNVEGGRQAAITRMLREISCPVSASIMSILSNFTIDKMDDLPENYAETSRDLPLIWSKIGKTSANRMEH